MAKDKEIFMSLNIDDKGNLVSITCPKRKLTVTDPCLEVGKETIKNIDLVNHQSFDLLIYKENNTNQQRYCFHWMCRLYCC